MHLAQNVIDIAPPTPRWHSPLPAQFGPCVVVPDFLDADTCRDWIARAEARGFASAQDNYPPSYRDNQRQVHDDPVLAAHLLGQLQALAMPCLQPGDGWQLQGINPRFRYCRYDAGQRFRLHQDGVYHQDADCRSRLTFMIYLTDGDAFTGGDTVFYAGGPGSGVGGAEPVEVARVRPSAGTLIVFDHRIWHAGAPLDAGVKHVIRSDLMFRRQPPTAIANHAPFHGHQGYVWTLATLGGLIAGGGRDTRIRLWNGDGEVLGELDGHSQSVLALATLPDGQLASASRDRTIRLWDVTRRQCMRTWQAHDGAVLCLQPLADGRLASGGADRQIRLWDKTQQSRSFCGHEGWIWAMAEPEADRLLSASEDGSVRYWQPSDGRCLQQMAGDTPLRCLAVTGANVFASGNNGGWIELWRRSAGQWHLVLRHRAHHAAVRSLCWVDTDHLASGGEDGAVRLWRIDKAFHGVHEQLHENFVSAVLALPHGDLLSASYDGSIVRHRTARQQLKLVT